MEEQEIPLRDFGDLRLRIYLAILGLTIFGFVTLDLETLHIIHNLFFLFLLLADFRKEFKNLGHSVLCCL